MASFILKKSDLAEFVKSLADEREVLGPVADSDQRFKFAAAAPQEFRLDFQNTYLSPKDLFFPQSEKMLEFSAKRGAEGAFIPQEIPGKPPPKLVLGIRPCDAKAFFVLDKIFQNDQYTDPYWMDKRQATVLISLGCNQPCPTCFCTSVGAGPFHEQGQDALAFDLGDRLLFKPLTARGEEVLKKAQEIETKESKMVPLIRQFKSLQEALRIFNRI